MKTILLQALLSITLLSFPSIMEARPKTSPTAILHQEISDLLKNADLSFLDSETETVTVDFVINARNEIVVLHTTGDNTFACDFVKKELNFRKVKFKQAKQLTPYTVNIQLIK